MRIHAHCGCKHLGVTGEESVCQLTVDCDPKNYLGMISMCNPAINKLNFKSAPTPPAPPENLFLRNSSLVKMQKTTIGTNRATQWNTARSRVLIPLGGVLWMSSSLLISEVVGKPNHQRVIARAEPKKHGLAFFRCSICVYVNRYTYMVYMLYIYIYT